MFLWPHLDWTSLAGKQKKCKRLIPEQKAPHVSTIKGNFLTIMVQMADFLIK